MEKIKFLNNQHEDLIIDVLRVLEFKNNLVKIIFEKEIPSDDIISNGFEVLNEKTNENISDDYYYKFNTIYQKSIDDSTVLLSSDGSVKVEEDENKNFVPII
jgi:hypothetical protein